MKLNCDFLFTDCVGEFTILGQPGQPGADGSPGAPFPLGAPPGSQQSGNVQLRRDTPRHH